MKPKWQEIHASKVKLVFRCPDCGDEETIDAGGLDDVPFCCECEEPKVLDRVIVWQS
jgi:hypothetical protein